MFFKGLVVLVLCVVANKADDDAGRECMKVLSMRNNIMDCCDDGKDSSEESSEMEEVGCEAAKQAGQALGYYKDDKPDYEGLKKFMMETLKDNPGHEENVKLVLATCSEGNYEDKLPKDECLPRKLLACIGGITNTRCQKWKSGDECMKASKVIEHCKTALLK